MYYNDPFLVFVLYCKVLFGYEWIVFCEEFNFESMVYIYMYLVIRGNVIISFGVKEFSIKFLCKHFCLS